MGIILDPTSESFRESLNSQIYVDKSMLIMCTNNVINTMQKYVCVSRPRRFGKSVAANMLCAYYGSTDSADMFETLKIAQTKDYKKYLNKFHVIHINMIDYINKYQNTSDSLDYLQKRLLHELKSAFGAVDCFDWNDLVYVLSDIYSAVNTKFVFIIDEWDCVFRRRKDDIEGHRIYLDFLRNLLKDKPYVALAYMTGILPIKKYGEHSALNMFTEISITQAREYAEYTGFTEDEVKALCDKYRMDYNEITHWYNGYKVNGIDIYNPKSVVEAMLSQQIGNYWTQTETYEALKIYIQADVAGLHGKIERLIAGDHLDIDITSFQNDMTSFSGSDDVLTLLIHLGYLTYDGRVGADRISKCHIPNQEVQDEFIRCIKYEGNWAGVTDAIQKSDKLLTDTINGNERAVENALRQLHFESTSLLEYNDENSLACLINLAYYAAKKYYTVVRELETGEGFADVVFIPYKATDKPAIIMELKYNNSADTAIKQIKEKRYHGALSDHLDNLLMVGIGYDRKSKEHTCKIERFTI